MIKNIIFDLGNVILKDNPSIVLENLKELDKKSCLIIKRKFFNNWNELDLGNETLEEHLENIDINILRNHDYASGVKTSIRLGLKSVPSSCDGALLIPADMPNITP